MNINNVVNVTRVDICRRLTTETNGKRHLKFRVMKETIVSDTIKKLSTEGIANVLRDQGGWLSLGYSMTREELEKFAQGEVNLGRIDEVYFIIELESE